MLLYFKYHCYNQLLNTSICDGSRKIMHNENDFDFDDGVDGEILLWNFKRYDHFKNEWIEINYENFYLLILDETKRKLTPKHAHGIIRNLFNEFVYKKISS